MTITNFANFYPVPVAAQSLSISPIVVEGVNAGKRSNTDLIDLAENKTLTSFNQTLLKAFDDMNAKQIKTEDLGKQMIIDPESVDIHDVTIAMAEASMSLKIAQAVIDRVIKSWNDITTTR